MNGKGDDARRQVEQKFADAEQRIERLRGELRGADDEIKYQAKLRAQVEAERDEAETQRKQRELDLQAVRSQLLVADERRDDAIRQRDAAQREIASLREALEQTREAMAALWLDARECADWSEGYRQHIEAVLAGGRGTPEAKETNK